MSCLGKYWISSNLKVLTKKWLKKNFKPTKFSRKSDKNDVSRMNGLYFLNDKMRFFTRIDIFRRDSARVNTVQIIKDFISECFKTSLKNERGCAKEKIKIVK